MSNTYQSDLPGTILIAWRLMYREMFLDARSRKKIMNW